MSTSLYRSIFDQFDLNGDGSVSCNELGVALEAAGVHASEAELQSMLKEADSDASGGIDFAEFVAFLDAFAGTRQQQPQELAGSADEALLQRRLAQIFQAAAELNGFDLVEAGDLRSLVESGGCDVTAAEAATMETVAAALGGRGVDLDEFVALWRAAAATGNGNR